MHSHFSCALITGASSGLGAEFVRQAASRCEAIVLTARREDRLYDLASELQQAAPKLSVFIKAADISTEAGRDELLLYLEENNICPDLLINNAGLGDYGEFASSDWKKTSMMLHVNMMALTHFTHALLPGIVEKKGGIINMSSLAASLPLPDFAVYAATKAYVHYFSEAVRLESREHGVAVLAVCPGPVATEFGAVAGRKGFTGEIFPGHGLFNTDKSTVVAQAFRSLERNRARLFPGWKAKLSGFIVGNLPLFIIRFVMKFRPRRVS